MTLAILIAISLMWLPVGLLFLGHGEPKGTGAICAFVGICVVVAAFVNVMQNDAFTAGLLFAHGLLYCVVAYALLVGLTDLRSMHKRLKAKLKRYFANREARLSVQNAPAAPVGVAVELEHPAGHSGS